MIVDNKDLAHDKATRAGYAAIGVWLEEQCRVLPPGTRLPSETQLAKQFEVSRMTARHALETLRNRGLIERRHGSGSFVALPALHRQESVLRSFSEEIQRRGETPSSMILDQSLGTAPNQALLMNLDPREPLVRIDRVRCSNGEPLAREVAYLPGRFKEVLSIDLTSRSLHEALANLGVKLSRATGYITSRLATAEECAILRQHEPIALLVESRILTDVSGEPVESTETVYVGARWAIDTSATVVR
ncbi:MAG: GntR family transcriptional regulator [Propionibacteriaceae bacterium]|nr:GntR family transcriptional regulator [Propionibacteriaceae bacterium]